MASKLVPHILLGFLLWAPALNAEDQHELARPGTINYVEGQARLASETLNMDSIGKTELDPGQTLITENGKVEVLLTPGVFVRVGPSSSLKMLSAGLTNTALTLDSGEAYVEVDEIHPENNIRIVEAGISTELVKTGLYNFDANLHLVRVLDGEATVYEGTRAIRVKAGHLVVLTSGEPLRVKKFDKKELEAEDLYRWTSLRSAYVAEANTDYAPTYSYGGFGWFGDGWYWDSWFDAYTFLPGDGIFYSPFGWGFYSPWCVFGAPFSWGAHYYHHFNPADRDTWGREAHYGMPTNYGHGVHYAAHYNAHGGLGGIRGGGVRGAFRGAMGSFHGGGLHGGGSGHK
jgi:hypothetical protein